MFWIFEKKSIKQAKEVVQGAKKLLDYRRDLLAPEKVRECELTLAELKQAIKDRKDEEIHKAVEKTEAVFGQHFPMPKHASIRENCEVILVVIVMVVGIKAYFVQPFKIPTGSMQPTLNGVIAYPNEETQPGGIQKAWEFIKYGRTYVNIVSEGDDNYVVHLEEKRKLPLFTYTTLVMNNGQKHTVFAPSQVLVQQFGIRAKRVYRKGESVAKGYIDTGDQVLVDKMSYHFVRPKRGDVFVFRTTGIKKIEQTLPPGVSSQFYIKRLVGVGGDVLSIDPPVLSVNGAQAVEPGIARVIRSENGYQGYSNGDARGHRFDYLGNPGETFQLPPNTYFALGDNSYHSSDSRNWGVVEEQNVIGRGLLVYWPFTRHWGLID